MGICEWSRPWGRRCTPASWFAPGLMLPQRGQLDPRGGNYPAFSPFRSGRLAGCQGCGAPPRRQHGARRPAAAGPRSPETTRPSVQLSAPLAAAGSEGSVASRDRKPPCATWGLTASCAPRQRHRGPAGLGDHCGSPSVSGGTDLSLLPLLSCAVALGSSSPGQILSLWRAALSNNPTIPCRAV